MTAKRISPGPSYLRVLLGLVLIVGILYLAKAFIIPLALAILLAFILTPIVRETQRSGLSRVPAVMVTVVLTMALIAGVGWQVGAQVNTLARQLPENKERIRKKIADLRGSGEGTISRLLQMFRELSDEPEKPAAEPAEIAKQVIVVRPEEASGFESLARTMVPVLEPLATAGFVVILVIFMLIRREDLRNRLIGLLGHGHLTGTTRVIVDAAQRLSSFLLTQLLVNVGFGIVFGLGLLVLGVPYAFLWGFLTAVLRFVPYIGTWISVAFPLTLSFALAPGWGQPISLLVFFVVMDLVVANVLEPLLFGHSTGVTPIALLVAAAFWTWIWGPIGLVLSTPLTVCLVALGQHVPRFQFLTLLMGDKPALAPHLSYYQRLLARDQAEAQQVATHHAHTQGHERVYDEVILPALALARHDRARDGLIAEDEDYIYQTSRAILAHLEDDLKARTDLPGVEPVADVLILGCPAHQEAEELSLQMLGLLLRHDGCRLEILSTKALPAEVEARVEREKPALVFIAVLPPGGVIQARYLCKRLRKRFADLPLVVGYWGESSDFDRLLVRFRSAGASYLTTSLLQSCSQIRSMLAQDPAPGLQPVGGP
jgi:predicted PurR-regulated permease PerM